MADLLAPQALLAAWLVTWLLHSTLLYGGAWLVERLRLLRAPAAREHLWRAAVVGALVTSTLQATGTAPRLPVGRWMASSLAAQSAAPSSTPSPAQLSARLPGWGTQVADASVPGVGSPGLESLAAAGLGDDDSAGAVGLVVAPPLEVSRRAPVALPGASPVASSTASPLAPPAAASRWAGLRARLVECGADALIGAWLIGTGLALLRLVALGWQARRALAPRAPAEGPLAAELASLCAALGVRRPALRVSPSLAGPVSLPNGEIAVPPWAASLDARQRRALLAHELAHQVRRDPQWQLFMLALAALGWMQPLHALARRRLVVLAELQADAWAARAVGDPRALVECLAECAERLTVRAAERAARLTDRRVALFGAAMTRDSLLVERVDSLLEDSPMRINPSWTLRGGVLGALLGAALLFPGCDMQSMHIGSGSSTSISIGDDGATSLVVRRSGYTLEMETDGPATFAADESDLATLAPSSTFTLDETLDGVQHVYTVTSDGSGVLTRRLTRAGAEVPLDAAGKAWIAAALPRMFRESGYDAEARVARLLAAGGPQRVLSEVELCSGDHAKACYLGRLLGTVRLDPEQAGLALAAASRIDSDYELRGALSSALRTQSLDAERFALLLRTAGQIGSDYESAELLVESAERLPDDAAARTAWLSAADKVGSDYELGRSLSAGLDASARAQDAAFTAQLVALAARRVGSDFELRSVLEQVAPRATDPAITAAYVAAVGQIGSDFEQRTSLLALLEQGRLDAAGLRSVLDVTARIGSNFEKAEVLKALAPGVATDAALSQRYREAASTLSSFERGEVLVALDEAGRLE